MKGDLTGCVAFGVKVNGKLGCLRVVSSVARLGTIFVKTMIMIMTPAPDPKQVSSTNLDNHAREIREEESWRRNHGAGFLAGIWEAFGRYLGSIWETNLRHLGRPSWQEWLREEKS